MLIFHLLREMEVLALILIMNNQVMVHGNMTGGLVMKQQINIKRGAQKDMREGSLRLQDLYIPLMILN